MSVDTQFGSGEITEVRTLRGHKEFLVEGVGFSKWIDEKTLRRTAENEIDESNSVDLPYNPTPQNPAAVLMHDESTLQPIYPTDAEERLHPSDSLTFEDVAEDNQPGPNPDLFADDKADVDGPTQPPEKTSAVALLEKMQREAYKHEANLDPRVAEYMDLVEGDSQLREAAWSDVRQKALRLRREGRVHVKTCNPEAIEGSVDGDTGTYDTIIVRGNVFDLGGQSVTAWSCNCGWGSWAFKRKVSFIGRFCSHAYAAYLEMQSQANKGKKQWKRKKSSHHACPSCGSRGFEADPVSGEGECLDCGSIIDNNAQDELRSERGLEWTPHGYDRPGDSLYPDSVHRASTLGRPGGWSSPLDPSRDSLPFDPEKHNHDNYLGLSDEELRESLGLDDHDYSRQSSNRYLANPALLLPLLEEAGGAAAAGGAVEGLGAGGAAAGEGAAAGGLADAIPGMLGGGGGSKQQDSSSGGSNIDLDLDPAALRARTERLYSSRREADALRLKPFRLTPDFVFNDTEDDHYFTDVTEDDRVTTGPDQIVHLAQFFEGGWNRENDPYDTNPALGGSDEYESYTSPEAAGEDFGAYLRDRKDFDDPYDPNHDHLTDFLQQYPNESDLDTDEHMEALHKAWNRYGQVKTSNPAVLLPLLEEAGGAAAAGGAAEAAGASGGAAGASGGAAGASGGAASAIIDMIPGMMSGGGGDNQSSDKGNASVDLDLDPAALRARTERLYSSRGESMPKEADALRLKPFRFTPDFVFNDTEDDHYFTDVTEDDRVTTGPEVKIEHLSSYDPERDEQDYLSSPSQRGDCRSCGAHPGEKHSKGCSSFKSSKLSRFFEADAFDDAVGNALQEKGLVDTTPISDQNMSQVLSDNGLGGFNDALETRMPGFSDMSVSQFKDNSDQGNFSPAPSYWEQLKNQFTSSRRVADHLPFDGSGPVFKDWFSSSEDWLKTHQAPMHDVTEGDGITKYTEDEDLPQQRASSLKQFFAAPSRRRTIARERNFKTEGPGDPNDRDWMWDEEGGPEDDGWEEGKEWDDNQGRYVWSRRKSSMKKVAGRQFSLREQQELINERHPLGARNLDELDLEGTHYLA